FTDIDKYDEAGISMHILIMQIKKKKSEVVEGGWGCPATPCEWLHNLRACYTKIVYMGNKKKSLAPQDCLEPGSSKRPGELDRYFWDKVIALTSSIDGSMAAPSNASDSPPRSPALYKQSTTSKDMEIQEILQTLLGQT
ncbi:Hypothetical predicted protein, partial [Pelobates cultripes]